MGVTACRSPGDDGAAQALSAEARAKPDHMRESIGILCKYSWSSEHLLRSDARQPEDAQQD